MTGNNDTNKTNEEILTMKHKVNKPENQHGTDIDWRTKTNSFGLGAGGSTFKQRATTTEKTTNNERQ